jgi:isoprenylcysteine carboxyl methyltransferase (ICMT) family protein YpbQ
MLERQLERRKHARITRRVASISNTTMQQPQHPLYSANVIPTIALTLLEKAVLTEALRACTHA